jgi:hypothetical protein
MWYSNLGKTFISRHILHQHWYTCSIILTVRQNPQQRSPMTVVSATSTPPFQPFCHLWNVCHQGGFSVEQTDESPRSSHCSSFNYLLSCLGCMGSGIVMMKEYPLCRLWNTFWSVNRTSQYVAEFTFSPCLWKWANSTPWGSQNMISITFPADDITLNFELFDWRWPGMFPLHWSNWVGSDVPMISPQEQSC